MLDSLAEILRHPLISLPGGTLSLWSLFIAVAILVLAYIAAVVLARAAVRLLAAQGAPPQARFAVAKIVRYFTLTLSVFIAAETIGINLRAVIAASTVILVGVGLGLQKVAENFVSGVVLLVEAPIQRGDFVRVGTDSYGTVDDIGARATRIITRDGVTVAIPNAELIGHALHNLSTASENYRVTIDVNVGGTSPVDTVRDLLLSLAFADPDVLEQPVPEVRLDGMSLSKLEFKLLVRIRDPREGWRIASRLRLAILAALRQSDIPLA